MTPFDIVLKLRSYKSLAGRKRLLASIPPDDNFWFEAHHGLSHFTRWPVPFILEEQTKHSGQVMYSDAPNVLRKIITGMMEGTLSESTFPKAVMALSLRCHPYEWEYWFHPVLTKSLRLPITVSVFNEYAPEEYRVPGLSATPSIPIMDAKSMPAAFYVEPLLEGNRVFWFLLESEVHCYLEDGTAWDHSSSDLFRRLLSSSKTDPNIVLEGSMENESIILTDIHDARVFLEGGKNQTPLSQRYDALRSMEEMIAEQYEVNIWAVESHLCKLDNPNTTREAFNTITQQGYPGVVLRHPEGPGGGMRVLVHPKRKSTLTCKDIAEGKDKYAGVAEYIIGTGTMNRKKFTSPVFSGLTFEDRKTILQDKASVIGQKFDVLSCGLGADGKLIFPVFKQWRRKP